MQKYSQYNNHSIYTKAEVRVPLKVEGRRVIRLEVIETALEHKLPLATAVPSNADALHSEVAVSLASDLQCSRSDEAAEHLPDRFKKFSVPCDVVDRMQRESIKPIEEHSIRWR